MAKGKMISRVAEKAKEMTSNFQVSEAEMLTPELVGRATAVGSQTRFSNQGGNVGPIGIGIEEGLNNILSLDINFTTINENYSSAQNFIRLCRATYWRVPIFKTAIDILTDLSNTRIHLRGGNAQSRQFFEAWMNRIKIEQLKAKFFLELYRGGNIFYYRVDASLTPSEILTLNKAYARKIGSIELPTDYIMLDPVQICVMAIAFELPCYYKILNRLELSQLKNSEDQNDQLTYQNLKTGIDAYSVGNSQALIKLDPDQIHTIFYQKQDYEPMAVPMGFCVLSDINLMLEMKKCDEAIARSVEYAILLITNGESPKDGGAGINPGTMNALKSMFKNESVSRVMVADYTTKADFIVPDLTKILVPAKYDEVNKTIAAGLYNIFFSEQKYADSVTKVRALSIKVENAQQIFLTEFLNKEIKRLGKLMGFKSVPVADMENCSMQDESNLQRVFAQLISMGILTAKDGLALMENGLYPSYDELVENQKEFKKDKDAGLFQPPLGGPYSQMQVAKTQSDNQMKLAQMKPQVAPGGGGRPAGTKAPQKTKKISQTGASIEDFPEESFAEVIEKPKTFSQKKVVTNTILLQEVKSTLKDLYKKEKGVKRFNEEHGKTLSSIANLLFENEKPEDWSIKAPDYIKDISSFAPNFQTIAKLEEIKNEFEVDGEAAVILLHSEV